MVAGLAPLTRRRGGPRPGAGSAAAPFARAEPEPRLVTAVRYRLRPPPSARPTPTAALLREAERRGLPNELLAVAERRWPQPRLRIRARRAGQRGVVGCARWAWTHGHAARPSAWSSRSASRDRAGGAAPSAATTGPHHAKQQHSNDHDDQHPQPCRHGQPPWSVQEQVKLTLLPPTRANNSPRPGDLPGRDRRPRYAQARVKPLHPATCPSIWAGRAGAGPAADHAQAPVGRALRAAPSQPSPTASTSTTWEEDPAGGNRPDATQRARPARYGEAEKRLPCLGGGTIQAWLC
jgi:hypothetical protein